MAAPAPSLRPFRAFSTPAYAALLTGAFISNVGTWMERIAVGVYAAEKTGHAGWTGMVTAVLFLPSTLIAPLGGALADRFERRRYLSVVSLVLTLLAGTLTALSFTDHLSMGALLVLMTLTGCASSFLNPGFTSLLSEVVPPEDFTSAIFMNSGQWNLARIVGPVFAAWIMMAGGVSWAFLLNTVSFLAVLAALAVAGVRRWPTSHHDSVWSGIRHGMGVVRRDHGIALALGIALTTGLLIAPFIGLAPAFAVSVLHSGAYGTSLLVACQGIGAVCASLGASTWLDRVGSRRWLQTAGLLLGPVAALYWLAGTQHVAMGAILVLGAVYLAVVTGSSNLCLSRAPASVRARVSSLFNMLLDGGYALGLMWMGWAADGLGLRHVAVAACGAYAVFFILLRRRAAPVFEQLDAGQRQSTSPQALPSSSTG